MYFLVDDDTVHLGSGCTVLALVEAVAGGRVLVHLHSCSLLKFGCDKYFDAHSTMMVMGRLCHINVVPKDSVIFLSNMYKNINFKSGQLCFMGLNAILILF